MVNDTERAQRGESCRRKTSAKISTRSCVLADQAPADSSKIPGVLLANVGQTSMSGRWSLSTSTGLNTVISGPGECPQKLPAEASKLFCSLVALNPNRTLPSIQVNTDKNCSLGSSCSGLSPTCSGAACGECASKHSSNCSCALTEAAAWLPSGEHSGLVMQ